MSLLQQTLGLIASGLIVWGGVKLIRRKIEKEVIIKNAEPYEEKGEAEEESLTGGSSRGDRARRRNAPRRNRLSTNTGTSTTTSPPATSPSISRSPTAIQRRFGK